MGEMADFFLEEVMEYEERAMDWRAGRMSTERAYDLGIIDERGADLCPGHKKAQMCRYCKTKGLYWNQIDNGKWRLFEGDKVHTCPQYRRT